MLTFKEKDIFAVYSLPGESTFTLIQQREGNEMADDFPGEADRGFLFHPFEPNEKFPLIFIQADLIHRNTPFSFHPQSDHSFTSTSKKTYLQLARKFITSINHEEFNKLVLSRIESGSLKGQRASDLFHALIKTYPNAFIYLINHPLCGTWIGASPEIFLRKKGAFYETMALAGTRLLDETGKMMGLWTVKERKEQQWVSDFISATLKKMDINFEITGPMNSKAGGLMHLKSLFFFQTANHKLCTLAKALHPTPAVCGLPKDRARQFILENEKHDRDYYTGFLGPVNMEEESHLFVNLRCVQLSNKHFVLYLGGGITADSQPEDEWLETVHKAGTMLKVLQTQVED